MQILLQRTSAGDRLRLRTAKSLRRLRFISALLIPFSLIAATRATQNVLVSWDPSPDTSVAGYNVYYGTASRTYTNVTAAAGVSATIPGLVEGTTYYFAVTALDVLGQESVFSEEVSYTPSLAAPNLKIGVASGGAVTLNGTGEAGHVYEIQATTNLTTWSIIGTRTAGVDGTFTFTNSAVNYPMRFFRFRDTTP